MRKLRIAEFTDRFGFGGTEKTLYTFCKHLDKDKFDITAVAFGSDPASGREQALRDLGIGVIISSKERLHEHLEKLGADIFHIHRGGWADPGPITAARDAGVPVIIEHNVFGRLDSSEENGMIDCHILISYSCAWRYQMMVRRPLVGPRYEVLYYPLEMDLYDRFGFDGRDFSSHKSIGRIGRDDNTKWDFGFLEAVPKVVSVFPDLEFHVMGITPEVYDALKSWGLEKNLVVHPMTTDENKIMEFYGGISVFTHFASMGETFGLVLAEAMAARLPVVTHLTPPLKDIAQAELVNSGYNGFVAVDAGMYADAVIALLSSPENARLFGQRGYEKARASYDAPVITHGLEDIFMRHARRKGLV